MDTIAAGASSVTFFLARDAAGDIQTARLGSTGSSPTETELRLQALDVLRYGLSACLFLGLGAPILEGADALLQVQAALDRLVQGPARREDLPPGPRLDAELQKLWQGGWLTPLAP
jgi:hypothetical protein